jgi:hypothetical protein
MTDAEHAELDLAVARAEIAAGLLDVKLSDAGTPTIQTEAATWEPFRPSCSWTHAGPIIQRDHISLDWDEDAGQWYAQLVHVTESSPMPLVAAMRAYVASRR